MANSKSSDIRYKVIDRCLRRGGYSTRQLMEAVNEELRAAGYPEVTAGNTIRADLDHIANVYDVAISEKRTGRNITYGYDDPSTSIFRMDLTDDEIVHLTQALGILSRFEGVPHMEWLSGFVERFSLSVDIDADNLKVVGFDDCVRLRGRKYFARLLSAICHREVLTVSYRKYSDQAAREFVVSPCYLKEHNRRWFLLGMTERYDTPIVLAFDRIEGIASNRVATYRPAAGYDFNNGYFKDIVGVTLYHDREPQDVVLEVENRRLDYILTKPIHNSQEVVERGVTSAIVKLRVIPNVELTQMILSYGGDVRVLSPASVRDSVLASLRKMLDNYGE